MVFVIDSNDYERFEAAKDELFMFFTDDTLDKAPLLVLANKQDLPNAKNEQHIIDAFNLNSITDRKWAIQATSMPNNTGIKEAVQLIESMILDYKDSQSRNFNKPNKESHYDITKLNLISSVASNNNEMKELSLSENNELIAKQITTAKVTQDAINKQSILTEWIARNINDSNAHSFTDEMFISQITDYSLNSWDHYTHIRLAYIFLYKHFHKHNLLHQEHATIESSNNEYCCDAIDDDVSLVYQNIEMLIKQFIMSSSRTNGKSFHATMTRFWCHMIAYQIEIAHNTLVTTNAENNDSFVDKKNNDNVEVLLPDDNNSFHFFLHSILYEPSAVDLWSTSLFKSYYSTTVMFSAEAKQTFVPPDIQPLPVLKLFVLKSK